MKIVYERGTKEVDKYEMYQLGNIIKFNKTYYLVVDIRYQYALLNLNSTSISGKFFDTLKELADEVYTEKDVLVDAELVIKS